MVDVLVNVLQIKQGKIMPRKIMMDTRDRLQEVGNNDINKGTFIPDGKCCLAIISPMRNCGLVQAVMHAEACPISINPLSIIMDMRRYLVMKIAQRQQDSTQ